MAHTLIGERCHVDWWRLRVSPRTANLLIEYVGTTGFGTMPSREDMLISTPALPERKWIIAARDASVVPSTFVATSCSISMHRLLVELADDQRGRGVDPRVDRAEGVGRFGDDAVDVVGLADVGGDADRASRRGDGTRRRPARRRSAIARR